MHFYYPNRSGRFIAIPLSILTCISLLCKCFVFLDLCINQQYPVGTLVGTTFWSVLLTEIPTDFGFQNVNRITTCGSHYLYSLRHSRAYDYRTSLKKSPVCYACFLQDRSAFRQDNLPFGRKALAVQAVT